MAAAALAWQQQAAGAELDRITQGEAVAALKAALDRGSQAAVASLGRSDGFLGNPQVRIPLPDSLARAGRLMRRVGMGHHADELVLTMNRAAEAAVPEARGLLLQAVKKMTVQDAKGILGGGETAGTDYFKRSTRQEIAKRFLPIVRRSTSKLGLARQYNRFAERGARLGLVRQEHADLDQYVTQKCLDGLYFMVAEEEKKIRRDPVGTASGIMRKVFGALR